MCSTHGVKFIGPSPQTIKTMGDKIAARELASSIGIPVVPGSQGGVSDVKAALRVADEIEYPVLIKAAAGGGGKGMRLVHNRKELERTLEVVQYEAQAAFGDGKVYREIYKEPRHIEIQILGDEHGNRIHLGERDCSIRGQLKLLENPRPRLWTRNSGRGWDSWFSRWLKQWNTAAPVPGFWLTGTKLLFHRG